MKLSWISLFCLLFLPLIGELKRSKYFIAIKKNDGAALNTLDEYIPFWAPQNRFYADPILFKHEGINYIFFEDFDYRKGVISYITVDEDLTLSNPQKVLELPIHLSFPYVFRDGDEIYMTPETYDHRSVSLFKATEFPVLWEQQRLLVQGENFADPILFKHNGYYWLFVAVQEDRLRIYYAEELNAPFKPHPINEQNLRGRNAGPIYCLDSRLIRPTMDCRKGYGRSMILKEILTLDTDRFNEQEIAYIEPNWAPSLDGTHTYCQNEDLVVYDGRRTIFLHEDAQYSSHEEPSYVEGKLTGQLGNQMFVIAATVSLSLDHAATPVFPDFLSDKTNNIPFYFKNIFYHLNTSKPPATYEYHEPFYHYSPVPYRNNIALHGYFQSEKYFKRHKKKILELFAPHPEIYEYLATKYHDLLVHPNTVALHLRSYFDHDPEQKVFIQYGRNYCEKAMALFPDDALFVIFSNRMDFCKRELASIQRPMIFIEEERDYHDLYLMSMCKHNIICNSSFSWWAAYLNPNPEKMVVTPPRWYASCSGLDDKDVVPEEWKKVKL